MKRILTGIVLLGVLAIAITAYGQPAKHHAVKKTTTVAAAYGSCDLSKCPAGCSGGAATSAASTASFAKTGASLSAGACTGDPAKCPAKCRVKAAGATAGAIASR